MNTSITSENETANSLLELLETYDNINISGVSKIIGTSSDIRCIIESDQFTGFNTTNLAVTGTADSNTIVYFSLNTTGIIENISYDVNVVPS